MTLGLGPGLGLEYIFLVCMASSQYIFFVWLTPGLGLGLDLGLDLLTPGLGLGLDLVTPGLSLGLDLDHDQNPTS